MPAKSKKSRSQSSRPAKKSSGAKSAKKKSPSAKTANTEVDVFSTEARQNLYYISHNAADCLRFRGFGYPSNKKKKDKRKGGKRKKKN